MLKYLVAKFCKRSPITRQKPPGSKIRSAFQLAVTIDLK
jgi:hypothetical protein